MESSSGKSNKIRDIVRLQQILKKWKKVAHTSAKAKATDSSSAAATNSSNSSSSSSSSSGNRGIKFLKKTLSFSDLGAGGHVPKGYIAVCVGKEEKRFVIPTEYLSQQPFGLLLTQAEEEFGFQQQGVLKLPCPVDLFQSILNTMEHLVEQDKNNNNNNNNPIMKLKNNIDIAAHQCHHHQPGTNDDDDDDVAHHRHLLLLQHHFSKTQLCK
ncbi:uncharacterized protein LOC127250546 [Andrographis paniculata]|uniref:uncharacterized protein LOC127250546 n=1 Tax=Andrographis paniculata TaxID=175694 RepID=UPI0021E82DD6|nr:uncharacterized protein LOC127250546 [Andrographis paniculata]